MKNQTYRMTMLYDFYGDLLTDRQREFYDLYYNEDLSLAEIAENYGITRQGVRDIIVRGEATLQEIEDKTGLIRRYHRITEAIGAVERVCEEIRELNLNELQNNALQQLVNALDDSISNLRKE
ncbi:MAG: DNA-binding protein [Firmicutes bacterium]|nr:DNA-binding protein [Bacillota bacterium]